METSRDARFWDRIAKKYSKSSISDQAGYDKTLTRVADFLSPDDQVLELGCGTGTTALHLGKKVKNYLATDFSPDMITIANEKLKADPTSPLTFRVAAAEEIAAEERKFDRVLGFNYIHLVRDAPETLRYIHSLLAPDGLLITKTPCLGDMNPLIRFVMIPAMRAVGKAPHVTSFKAKTLSELIKTSGFDILHTEQHASKGKDTRPFIVAQKKSSPA